MLVSELRHRANDKRNKDLEQAAVLAALLGEREEGALAEAFAALPSGARGHVATAAAAVIERLETAGHARAADAVRDSMNA